MSVPSPRTLLCGAVGLSSVVHGHASTFVGCCTGRCSLDCVRVVLYYYYYYCLFAKGGGSTDLMSESL